MLGCGILLTNQAKLRGLWQARAVASEQKANKQQQQGKRNTQETAWAIGDNTKELTDGQWIGLKTLLLINLRICYPADQLYILHWWLCYD